MSEINFVEPWTQIGADGKNLEAELYREVGSGHQLFGKNVKAIARRSDCDDVLFEVTDKETRYAVVHLTWSGSSEADARLPETTIYSSLDEWQKKCMIMK